MASKITENSRNIAAQIIKTAHLDESAGQVVDKSDEGIFFQTLPEGVTKEIVTQIRGHEKDFAVAAVSAVGQIANDSMKKNKELDRVVGSFDLGGKETLSVAVDRSKTYQVGPADDRKSITKHGVTRVERISPLESATGAMRDALTEVAAVATENFNKMSSKK